MDGPMCGPHVIVAIVSHMLLNVSNLFPQMIMVCIVNPRSADDSTIE